MRYDHIVECVRAAHSACISPVAGSLTSARRAATPYIVECPGLTVRDLGARFADKLQGLRLWCRRDCAGEFSVEPIRDAANGRDIGRRLLFADEADAARFRQRWC